MRKRCEDAPHSESPPSDGLVLWRASRNGESASKLAEAPWLREQGIRFGSCASASQNRNTRFRILRVSALGVRCVPAPLFHLPVLHSVQYNKLVHEPWPHAPPHYFTPDGTYLITAATLHRKPLFNSGAKLSYFRDTTFRLAANYDLSLQAWAFFPNHYHLVISFDSASVTHRNFIRHLHRELALRLNGINNSPGQPVMYQFWDTHLTFEKSWLARLKYVHHNPVHHGLTAIARDYEWCSAGWFESNGRAGFVKSVYSFKTDKIKVPDDF